MYVRTYIRMYVCMYIDNVIVFYINAGVDYLTFAFDSRATIGY